MRLVADESVDRQIVEQLRLDGYNVLCIAELESGISDEEVLARANEAKGPLLTTDKDFGELVFRQKLVHHGVVLLRLTGISSSAKRSAVSVAFREHSLGLVKAFTVVLPGLVRIRKGS